MKTKVTQKLKSLLTHWESKRTALALSVGLGCILSFYVIGFLKIKIPNRDMINMIQAFFAVNNSSDIAFSSVEVIILLLGIVFLVSSPLLYQKNGTMIFLFTIVLFMDIVLVFRALVQDKVDTLFMICITLSCVFFVWLCGIVLKSIYHWIKTDDKKIDMAKLTFVWTVIIAIWGLLK